MVNPDTFELPLNMLISGSTKSGKTYLTKKILNEHILPNADWLIICCPTMQFSGDYDEFKENKDPDSPKLKIVKIDTDFENVITEIIESQKALMIADKERCPQVVLLLDDLIASKLVRNSGTLDTFSAKSRHINVSMIFLTQKTTGVSRTIRLNSSVAIILSNFNHSENEAFCVQYCPKKYKSKLLDKLQQIFNKKHNYLLCDNRCPEIFKRMWINGTELLNFDEM